jgi:hypothetical protein
MESDVILRTRNRREGEMGFRFLMWASVCFQLAMCGNLFRCLPYNSTTQECYTESVVNSSTLMVFSRCPAKAYCPIRMLLDYRPIVTALPAKCASLKAINAACSYAYECDTNMCINGKCTTSLQANNSVCTHFYECTAQTRCLNNVCNSPSVSMGGACYKNENCPGIAICDRTICIAPMSKAKGQNVEGRYACQSFYMKNGACDDAPVLQDAGSNGLRVCTKDSDCTYLQGGVKKTAAELNKTCIKAEYSDENKMYCEFGEGDPVFREGLLQVRAQPGCLP